MDAAHRIEAQPPFITSGERCDFFTESKLAQAQYLGHRSAEAPANTRTFHIVAANGEVAGFISFRIAREEFDDPVVIHFSVEYIYVLQKFRMRGLGRQLLEPLVQALRATVHEATSAGNGKPVRLQSASSPESLGGGRLLKELETRVSAIASTCGGVTLVGRYINRPVYISSTWESGPELSDAPGVAH